MCTLQTMHVIRVRKALLQSRKETLEPIPSPSPLRQQITQRASTFLAWVSVQLVLRMAGHAPYIMPDGTTLSQLLSNNEAHEPAKRNRKNRTAKADRWERSFRLVRSRPPSEAEQSELDYLYKVGRERRRRFLNDKMLRDMAGPLTASEMEGLFKPVPFGDSRRVSPLQEVLQPENAIILDMFRNIDYDKQTRFMQVIPLAHTEYPLHAPVSSFSCHHCHVGQGIIAMC